MAIVIQGDFKPSDPMGLYKGKTNPLGATQTLSALAGTPGTNFDTPLTDKEAEEFKAWKAKYAPNDSGDDYDLRGAFKAGLTPDPANGHFPDTFKKPNHPTFSVESRYAQFAPDLAGAWDAQGNYVPSEARARAEAAAKAASDTAAAQAKFNELDPKSPGRYTLIPANTYDKWKADWEKTNRSTGLLGDTTRLLDAGSAEVEQGLNTMIGMIPVIGKPLQNLADAFDKFAYGSPSYAQRMQDVIDKDVGTLTPETQAARGEQWWDAQNNRLGTAWLNPRSYFSGLVESLPSTVITMAPGMLLARGAFVASIAAGTTERVAAAAAAKTALVSGALTEGAFGGAQSADAVRQAVAAVPREKLLDTEAAKAMLSQGMSPDDVVTAIQNDSATQAFILGGVATGMFGGFGDRFLAKLIAEGVGGTLAKRIVAGATRGIVAEGLFEEAPQNAAQQIAQNLVVQRNANPDQNLMEGVADQALGGLAIGGVMGGGLGGIGGAARPSHEAPAAPAAPTPAPAPTPTAPRPGPLSRALQHGLDQTAPAEAPVTLPDVAGPAPSDAPIAAERRVIPDAQPVPVSTVDPSDAPEVGQSVIVENAALGRVTARVEGYEPTEDGGLEAVVSDQSTGQIYQVPLADLRTAKLTDQLIAKMDSAANPPAPADRVDTNPDTSRSVHGSTVIMPDAAHAQLFDLGAELKTERGFQRTLGGDALKIRDHNPALRHQLAEAFQIPEDRVNQLADDYRMRVERAGRTGSDNNLPINMHAVPKDIVLRFQNERLRAERDAAKAANVPEIPDSSVKPAAPGAVPEAQTLADIGEGGGAIIDNMYEGLWAKVQAGETKEGKSDSALLQAAARVRKAGGLKSLDEFKALAKDYASIERGPFYQQQMRALVAKHTPNEGGDDALLQDVQKGILDEGDYIITPEAKAIVDRMPADLKDAAHFEINKALVLNDLWAMEPGKERTEKLRDWATRTHPKTDEARQWIADAIKKGASSEASIAEKPPTDSVEALAHEAATSPQNDLPEPTEAQKEAGNYKMGHVALGALDISIENPAGSTRSGTDKGGKPWSVEMKHHYGYIRGTVGKDKDHVDVFVRKGTEALADDAPVFVVDQNNAEGGFDEHKVMLGFNTVLQAKRGYLANYSKGWKGAGAVTQTTLKGFKQWLAEGDTSKQFSDVSNIHGDMPEPTALQYAIDEEKKAKPPAVRKSDEKIAEVLPETLPTATAPEHVVIGVDDRELGQIVAEFNEAQASMMDGENPVTNIFAAPAKTDIVRLGDKVKVYNKDHGWMTPAEAKARIEEWKAAAAAQGTDPAIRRANASKVVLSLFDLSGKWSQPWEDAGYQVYRFDIQNDKVTGDVNNFSSDFFGDWFGDFEGQDIYAILAACPCTDFAVSGARHFAAKDADGRTVASVKLVHQTLAAIEYFKPAVWAIENPVGRIEKLGGLPPWRLSFEPNHLGDPYTKKTLIWGRFNADLPIAPVEPTEGSKMHAQYGGKSMATKNARSVTPEGFAYGFFAANNAHEHEAMAVANKYDRLDRALIAKAIDAGVTPEQIDGAVEDFYYQELDDAAANKAIRALIDGTPPTKAPAAAPAATRAESAQVAPAADAKFAKNKLFTADKVEAARARLRSKMGQLNSGVDPEVLVDGMTIAGAYIEAGVREFADFAKSMTADLGDAITPFLLAFWEGARNYPGLDTKGMTSVADSAAAFAKLTSAETQATVPSTTEEGADVQTVGRASPGALERVPAEPVPSAPGEREAGSGAERGGGPDVRGSGPDREERVQAGRGVPDGEGEVSLPAAGERNGGVSPETETKAVEAAKESGATPSQSRPDDFAISDDDAIGRGGAKTKFRYNIAAIKVVRTLAEEDRPARRDEQKILAKWVGWGGLSSAFPRSDGSVAKGWEKEAAELKSLLSDEEYRAAEASTRNAHYTAPEVVKAMWSVVQRLGFRGGLILEPSIGAGNFIGLLPADLRKASHVTGIELETVTGAIAKHLYPAASIFPGTGFQEFSVPDGHFDLAIGNPPFGSEKLFDKERRELNRFSIHNYFFAKSIDGLKPGGVLAMVVTNFFLDAKAAEARAYIAERADLLGAIRLPNNAFLGNAGTEVTTDIVLLRKKDGAASSASPPSWTEVGDITDAEGRSVPLNRYFIAHPEMMLGKFGAYGTMYRGAEPALVARDGDDLSALLAQAIERLPRDVMAPPSPLPVPAEKVPREAADAMVGSAFATTDGAVMVRLPDRLGELRAEPIEFPNARAKERVTGMIAVRDAFTRLRRAQVDADATDAQIERLRERMNKAYDGFVAKNGPINSDANKRLFREDPTWPQIAALEEKFDAGLSEALAKKTGEPARPATAEKARIFTTRTQAPYQPVTSAKTAKDALAASLSDLGAVNLAHMERLYGKPADQIVKELGPLLYKEPGGAHVTADDYLSGNVKTKLRAAEDALARGDGEMERNIAALKDVIPADIEAVDIDVKVGAPWVPASYMQEFVAHIAEQDRGHSAKWVANLGRWFVTVGHSSESARARYSTDRAELKDVLDYAFNGKTFRIMDEHRDSAGTHTEFNEAATDAANEKLELVKKAFKEWIWDDDARRAVLSRLYNDTFNTDVERVYDGSHLQLPGKVADDIIELRPHQKAFVWRGLQGKTLLGDHAVGAGKTFATIALVMEKRRTGQARKPMVVVPNHLVGQWAADFLKLYPGAKVLAATKADFEADRRKKLFARVATGDWDAVVVAHSSFGKVPVDPAFEADFLREQIDDLETSRRALEAEDNKSRSVKQLAKMREALETRLTKLLEGTDKDVGMTFEEMGIDFLAIDEAHEFKNLGFATSMQRVAGLGNTTGSQKAADLYVKVRSTLARTGGRNVVFLTGTPVSNSMAEMYTLQRYLDYEALRDQGVAHFDAWAKVFGEVVTDWELSPSGKYKLNSRFARFVNMPELMQRYRAFADVITNDDIKRQLAAIGKTLPLPKVKGGKPQIVVVPPSGFQRSYIGEPSGTGPGGDPIYPENSLVYRAEHLPRSPKKGEDNMLKVMSDARKAALDMRLIDPNYPDVAGTKVHVAAANIRRIYDKWQAQRGTQLVFIDLSTPAKAMAAEAKRIKELIARADDGDAVAQEALDKMSPDEFLSLDGKFSVYDDLKEKLVATGIPADEIAFIHDANTELQKEELFGKVRSGRVRVLFGSTPKMGAGTNVQNRLVALHHLDAPWRPSDLEQRDGRGIRQGNELYAADPHNFEIEILRYATEKTLDARQWQTIEGKARFVGQLRQGAIKERSVEDIGGEAANAAEMKAAASGNPLILEEINLRQKIRKLENAESEHRRQQHRIKGRISSLREEQRGLERRLPALVDDAKRAEAIDAAFTATVNGVKVDKPKELGTALITAAASLVASEAQSADRIGTYGTDPGFAISLNRGIGLLNPGKVHVLLEGAEVHTVTIDDVGEADATGLAMRVRNTVSQLTDGPDRVAERVATIEKEVPRLEKQLAAWPDSAELAAAAARHAELMSSLRPQQAKPAPAPVKASIAEGGEGSTVESITAELRAGQFGPIVDRLVAAGRVRIIDGSEAEGPAREAQAWTEFDGRITLNASNLPRGEAQGVLLHEAFHSGAAALLGDEQWVALRKRLTAIMRQFKQSRGKAREFYDAARERLGQAAEVVEIPEALAAEEFGAYAIEEYENTPPVLRKWVDDVIGAVKAWLLKRFGRQVGAATPAQLRALAAMALRDVVGGPAPGMVRASVGRAQGASDIAARVFPGLIVDPAFEVAPGQKMTAAHARNFYTGIGYAQINKWARDGAFPAKVQGADKAMASAAILALIDSAAPLPSDVKVYRGRSAADPGVGFTSWSTDRAVAEAHATKTADGTVDSETLKAGTLAITVKDGAEREIIVLPKALQPSMQRASVPGRVLREARGKWTDVQPLMLATVPLTYFTELARPGMTAVREYLRVKRAMDAFRGTRHEAADKIAQDWLKYTRLGSGLLPSEAGKARAAQLADLMHEATLAGVDPSQTDDESVRHPSYAVLRAKFLALPPAGRALFERVRDAYREQVAEQDQLILENVRKAQDAAKRKAEEDYANEIDRIEHSGLSGLDLRDALDKATSSHANALLKSHYANKARLTMLRKAFEKNRVPSPYFPLARFGRYFVTIRNAGGDVVSFSRRETAAERDRLVADLRAELKPDLKIETGVMDEAGAGRRDQMDPRIVAEIQKILGDAGVDDVVMDAIWQRYLQTMPDLSTRKRFIHRKGTAGFDADALRAFSSHFFHAAHQMARLKYGVDLQEMLDQVAIQARNADDPTRAMTLANELAKRHRWVMDPKGSSAAQAITSAMFIWHLGLTPAAALVNLTQTPMLGVPILGARYGMAKAAGALLGAAKDFAAGRGTVAKGKLNEDERWALGKFYESGLIDRTRSHDLAGVGNTGVKYSPLRARVMSIISWGFHATEVANREVTALAAYRLARQAGLSSEAALDQAHDMTWKIHFDYSNSSRARFMQNDAAKLLLVFQNYTLNAYYRLFRDIHQSLAGETGQARREARLQLAGMMGMMTLMGGVTGLFGFHVLMALAGIFFDDKDDPMDFETEMRRHVIDLFGNDVGSMILNGVPGTLLNVDLTSRIGMPDFFVRAPTDPNLDGRDWYQQMLVNALGVVPSTLLNGLDGFSLIREGNTFRGLELLAPKALKDAMQAYRFANQGVTTRRQDEIVPRDALGAWETITKALGFTSATVAEAYDRKSALSNAQTEVMNKRSVLLNQLAMAIEMGDDDTRRQVLDRIMAFNANPIHRAVVITSETIKRSLAARRRRRQNVQEGVSVSNRALGSQLEDLLP